MKDIIPLLQTALWVGLIGGIVYRYHDLIETVIRSLQKRIDAGGGLKAGPFELPAIFPLDPEQQVRKLNEDVAQLVEAEAAEDINKASKPTDENIRTLYLSAEDLALREIQFEFQIPIGRQVQLGSNLPFDGAFAKDGRLHIVEVKYSRHPIPRTIVEQAAAKIFGELSRRQWKTTRLIFSVVYGDSNIDLVKERQRIAAALSAYDDKTEIRCYKLSELAEKFGLTPDQVMT